MYVEVYVDERDALEEVDTDDLYEELKRRGENTTDPDDMRELLETIWHNRRNGKPFDAELDKLIYGVLGKVI